MSNNDEMAHDEPSDLDLCCLQTTVTGFIAYCNERANKFDIPFHVKPYVAKFISFEFIR